MSEVPPAIRDAYDPERFRSDGHRLIDALADQLADWQARRGQVLPWREPSEARDAWASEPLDGGDLVDDLTWITRNSIALVHPRYLGHQVPPPLPGAALAELASALLNNGMAVAEMGPASTPIELAVVDWMRRTLGMPEGAGGVLTSGGSLGNMTALLAMRQVKAGGGSRSEPTGGGGPTSSAGGAGGGAPRAEDVWQGGAHAGPPLAVIVSSDAHYSVARTARVMGWGDAGVIAARVDAKHRLTADAVARALETAGDQRVLGIVAAAGSTATGAFDPLDELADLAAERGLWLHVDAAHGGAMALSPTHRARLRGIERADSVVWDAHKLLLMPALVTAVLYKHGGHAYEAFAQQASYLFAGARPDETWWDLGTRTLECTKRAMAIELWCALRVHGEAWFGEVIDRQVALAGELAARIRESGDFELAVPPESNIVCYRHRPPGLAGAELDAHNRALRARLVADGTFYIVGTQLPGGYHLRSALMNPLIERSDLDELLAHLRTLAAR